MNAAALRLALVAAASSAILLGACSRAHITPTHGRAFREAFAIQDANPNRSKTPKSINGLDSQEATIIAKSYRKDLAPKIEQTQGNQLLMISPNQGGGGQATVLSPSVPSGN
jgi:hypothetical protein